MRDNQKMIDPTSVRPGAGVSSTKTTSSARRGLHVRFVTRMSGDLSMAVTSAARNDGLTAGAWVRRLLLERVGVDSPDDARSGRPVRRPEADAKAISGAIRQLAAVSCAVSTNDKAAAQSALQEVRSLLIPLVVHRPEA